MWSAPIAPSISPKAPAIRPLSMSRAAMAAISVRPKSMITTISADCT